MNAKQWTHIEPEKNEPTCSSTGPEGWWCCLPEGHEGNHIGFVASYRLISQWEDDDADHS